MQDAIVLFYAETSSVDVAVMSSPACNTPHTIVSLSLLHPLHNFTLPAYGIGFLYVD